MGAGWLTGATNVASDFLSRLSNLAMDYGQKINISSGRRSREEQQAIWDQRKADHPGEPDEVTRQWVALPGNSRHETGLAADINDSWIQNLGNDILSQYGLNKRLANEPWHVEML